MCHPRNKGLLQEMIRNVEVWPGFPNMMSFWSRPTPPQKQIPLYIAFQQAGRLGAAVFLTKLPTLPAIDLPTEHLLSQTERPLLGHRSESHCTWTKMDRQWPRRP